MLAGHGVHGLPFGEAVLEVVVVVEDDIELLEELVQLVVVVLEVHTHLFARRSPFLLKLGGKMTRDETTVRAALVKKFYQVSTCLSPT